MSGSAPAAPAATATIEQVVPDRRRRMIILAVCSMSLLIVSLDATILNVALPSIHRTLHSSLSALQWTIDAYTVVVAGLLMLSASTGDRLGRRRMFRTGLVLFVLGSMICGAAPDTGVLIAARALQAIGGSMLNPMALAVVRNVFVDPRERAMAVGIWGAVPGISMSLGPIIGGALVSYVSWRAVFYVNLPIGLAAFVLSGVVMPESRAPRPRRIDPVGQILLIVALATVTYAVIGAPGAGWLSVQTLGLGGVSLVAWMILTVYELRRREPLVEVRAFRSVPLVGATVSALCVYTTFGGFLLLNTLYLQDVRGLSALMAGVWLLPMPLATLLAAPLSGRITGRRGPRIPLLAGGATVLLAGLLLTRLTAHDAYPYLGVSYLLLGLGTGLLNPPITNTAVSGFPPEMSGVAAAITSTGRQTGQVIGVAVLGAIAGGGLVSVAGTGFVTATHAAWWIVVGLGAVIVVLGAVTSTARARATARVAAAAIAERSTPIGAAIPSRDTVCTQ